MRFKMNSPADLRYIDRKIMKDVKKRLSDDVVPALQAFQNALRFTPVYTGRTLANFRWSLSAPILDRRAAIAKPSLPGKTSDLAIGEEPRRDANMGLIEGEFRNLLRGYQENPFQKVFLTNNLPNFTDVEYGTYSSGARTPPGGMVRRGEAVFSGIVTGARKVE